MNRVLLFTICALALATTACAGAQTEVVASHATMPVSMSRGVRDTDGKLVPEDRKAVVGKFEESRTAWGMAYSLIKLTPETDISDALNVQVARAKGSDNDSLQAMRDGLLSHLQLASFLAWMRARRRDGRHHSGATRTGGEPMKRLLLTLAVAAIGCGTAPKAEYPRTFASEEQDAWLESHCERRPLLASTVSTFNADMVKTNANFAELVERSRPDWLGTNRFLLVKPFRCSAAPPWYVADDVASPRDL